MKMKYAICKVDNSPKSITEVPKWGVEEHWAYKVVEDNGGEEVIVVEEIVGLGKTRIPALRAHLCEITEEEYKLIDSYSDGESPDELDKLIESAIKRDTPL
jgi:hypothetical protein